MNSWFASHSSRSSYARVVLWALTLAWAMLIFYFSTRRFGPDFSDSLLTRVLAFLQLSVSSKTFAILSARLRKTVHVIEYGVLAVSLYGACADRDPFRWRQRRALWCIFIAAAYSLTDEFHQAFVPGRNASLADYGIDAIGAAIAVALLYLGPQALRLRLR
jgi:VanZ family protein